MSQPLQATCTSASTDAGQGLVVVVVSTLLSKKPIGACVSSAREDHDCQLKSDATRFHEDNACVLSQIIDTPPPLVPQ